MLLLKSTNLGSKEIYLIRHGETEYNRMRIVQGSGINAPLNTFGKAQAAAFHRRYQHIAFDKIYTSTLLRAQQTVALFKGIPIEHYAALNEISWGIYEGQNIYSPESKAYFETLMQKWRMGETSLAITGGDSPEMVANRMKPFVQHLFEQEREKRILISMHGRSMRILLCLLLNKPLYEMEKFHHQNLSLYHLHFDNGALVKSKENCLLHLESQE